MSKEDANVFHRFAAGAGATSARPPVQCHRSGTAGNRDGFPNQGNRDGFPNQGNRDGFPNQGNRDGFPSEKNREAAREEVRRTRFPSPFLAPTAH